MDETTVTNIKKAKFNLSKIKGCFFLFINLHLESFENVVTSIAHSSSLKILC